MQRSLAIDVLGRDGNGDDPPVENDVDDALTSTDARIVEVLHDGLQLSDAREILRAHRDLPLRMIFSGFDDDLDLRTLPLGARNRNTLARAGIAYWKDIRTMSVGMLATLRGMGKGSLLSFISQLIQTANDRSGCDHADAVSAEELAAEAEARARCRRLDSMRDRLESWCVALGYGREDWQFEDLPLSEPLKRLRGELQADGSHITCSDTQWPTLAQRIDTCLDSVRPRQCETLRARVFADERVTLEQLGQVYGVTRERVRQIQVAAEASLGAALDRDEVIPDFLELLHRMVGRFTSLQAIVSRFPALAFPVASASCPVWKVLQHMEPMLEISEHWCARPSLAQVEEETRSALVNRADAHGVALISEVLKSAEQLFSAVSDVGRDDVAKRWLEHCGYVLKDGFVLMRTANLQNRARAQLAMAKQPVSTAALMEWAGSGCSEASLRNHLSSDEQIVRVDRDRWALAEWGIKPYKSIRSAIEDILNEAGEPVLVTEVLETVTSSYKVSKTSVLAYASGIPFRIQEGKVEWAERKENAPYKVDLTRTIRTYRHPKGVVYRFAINQEHLRGSGSIFPNRLADFLEILPGGDRSFLLNGRSWRIYRKGLQPTMGSIRAQLQELGANNGQIACIVFASDQATLSVTDIPDAGMAQILALVGRPTNSDDPWREVADALWLSQECTPWEILATAKKHSEHDLARSISLVLDRCKELVNKGSALEKHP